MKTLERNKKVIAIIIFGLLAYVFVWEICQINILHINKPAALSIITGIFVAILSTGYLYWRDYRPNPLILLVSFVFTTLYLVGFVMRNSDGAGVFEYYAKALLLAGAAGTPMVAYMISRLFEGVVFKAEENNRDKSAKSIFLINFIVLLVAWIPVFCAYFPGVFAYDVHTQVTQMNNNEYTTHHPLIHTLLLRLFYKFGEGVGSYNLGIALYTIFQMLLMAGIYAYLLWYLYDRGVNKKVRIIILLLFALCPIHSLLTISATKDTLFSAFMVLFVVMILQMLEKPALLRSKRKCCLLVISGTMTFLFRNNAKYAMLLWMVVLGVFILRAELKKGKKRIFVSLLLSILIVGQLSQIGMTKMLDASPGSINEMLSIPSAQIARCYFFKSTEMEPELAQKIAGLGITPGDYVLTTVDIVKGRIQIENQKKYFLQTWWDVFREYPAICIDAFLYINQGNLFLEDISNAYVYGASLEGRMGYLLTNTAQGYGVEHHSLFPQLEQVFENLFSINEYQNLPVISLIFVPSLYFWLLVVGLLHALVTGRKNHLMAFLLLACYFATVLFGPCSLIRYMYPLVVGAPVLLALEFGSGNKKVNLRR